MANQINDHVPANVGLVNQAFDLCFGRASRFVGLEQHPNGVRKLSPDARQGRRCAVGNLFSLRCQYFVQVIPRQGKSQRIATRAIPMSPHVSSFVHGSCFAAMLPVHAHANQGGHDRRGAHQFHDGCFELEDQFGRVAGKHIIGQAHRRQLAGVQSRMAASAERHLAIFAHQTFLNVRWIR